MEITNKFTNKNLDIRNPEKYINKINEYNGRVNVVLDEFQQVYIMSKMYPANEEVQERYENMISNIEKLQSDLFNMTNNIQVDVNEVNKNLLEINTLINIEKIKNEKLKKLLGYVEGSNNSSQEMISDYKKIYNLNYLRNWSLFLSTILCIIVINMVYKKNVV
jgi:glycerol-3-phosphate cytidylyltransferase-like family protein